MDRIAFRLEDLAGVAGLTAWGNSAGTVQQAGNTQSSESSGSSNLQTSNGIIATYQVQHNHTFGNCRGNLIFKENGIAYESINEIDHSRQWAFRDVRELDRDNPYRLGIEPFSGDHYEFDFMGKGLDNNVFQRLVQRVTSARVAE